MHSAFWNGECVGSRCHIVVSPDYRQLFDHAKPNVEAVADAAVDYIRADVESGDELVLPTLYCDFGTISTAKLYGGRVISAPEGGMVHIEPVVSSPGKLNCLQACPFEESDFQLAIDLYRMVCEKLGTDELFMRTPDFQGPLNTLALVMDQQELLMAMYTDAEDIHHALEGITTTLIDYHQQLRRTLGGNRVIGNIWPYIFIHEHSGVSLTQDMMPLLSPEMYRDFEIPQLKRIADAFGGVVIHCCGRYSQHLLVLKESGINILGLEFHHPFTSFSEVYAVFGDSIVYIPYLFSECKDFPDYIAFAKSLQKQGTEETRLLFAQTEACVDVKRMRQLLS